MRRHAPKTRMNEIAHSEVIIKFFHLCKLRACRRDSILLENFQYPDNDIINATITQFDNDEHTSKQEIMIPHAGIIFAILGAIPVNSAFGPSMRTICTSNGIVGMARDIAPDIIRACLRVFITSNGDVMRAAVHPLIAPLKNATCTPAWPWSEKRCFQVS